MRIYASFCLRVRFRVYFFGLGYSHFGCQDRCKRLPGNALRAYPYMSVDHGGGGEVPRIWSGDTNAICPPQILSYCYKVSVCGLQNTPNSVSGRGSARTLLGELTTLSDSLVGWGVDTPPHTSPHSEPIQSFGACHASPQNSSQIYAICT